MTAEPPWKPSRWEQHLLWWLTTIMRYPVGGGGVVYSALVIHDPVSMLVFGAIATSMDVGQLVVTLTRSARDEAKVIESHMRVEEDRVRDDSQD